MTVDALPFWIVGRTIASVGDDVAWDFQGLFTTEAGAVAACEGHPNYWIAPAVMGELLPEESRDWRGLYYPSRPSDTPPAAAPVVQV